MLLWLAVWLLLRLCYVLYLLHSYRDTFPPSSLGVYGDVMRVKILFNKKENALIQMSDGTQAQLGSYTSTLQNAFFFFDPSLSFISFFFPPSHYFTVHYFWAFAQWCSSDLTLMDSWLPFIYYSYLLISILKIYHDRGLSWKLLID